MYQMTYRNFLVQDVYCSLIKHGDVRLFQFTFVEYNSFSEIQSHTMHNASAYFGMHKNDTHSLSIRLMSLKKKLFQKPALMLHLFTYQI